MRQHQTVCYPSKPSFKLWIAALLLTVLARAGAAAPLELSSPNAEIIGLFGWSVSMVPDVNEDGQSDVVVGAYLEDSITGATDAGRAYILCGSTGAVLHSLVSPDEKAFGAFGCSVSGVPDVNGDGRGDVIVGACGEDGIVAATNAGRAYIFSGSDGSLLRPLFSPNARTGGFFGFSVSGIPDIDRDGRGDLLVGAYREDAPTGATNAGQVYVFSGFDGRILHALTSPNSQVYGAFGISVSGVPDVDGDTLVDLVVGADKEDSIAGPEFAGRAYIFSSSDWEVLHTLVSPNEQREGWFGVSVSGTADVDGDRRGDVVVGAQFDSSATGPQGGRTSSPVRAERCFIPWSHPTRKSKGTSATPYPGWPTGTQTAGATSSSERVVRIRGLTRPMPGAPTSSPVPTGASCMPWPRPMSKAMGSLAFPYPALPGWTAMAKFASSWEPLMKSRAQVKPTEAGPMSMANSRPFRRTSRSSHRRDLWTSELKMCPPVPAPRRRWSSRVLGKSRFCSWERASSSTVPTPGTFFSLTLRTLGPFFQVKQGV